MVTENPAKPADLTSRGYSGPANGTVQQTWLDVAFRALRRDLSRLGVDLDARLEDTTLDKDDVVDVVAAAALRVLRNPDGVEDEQESGSIDNYSESRTVKRGDATQDVYFTAAELRRFTPIESTGGGWVGSVKYL